MMTSEQGRALSVAAQARPVGDILGSAPEPGVLSGVVSEIPRGAGRGLAAAQGLAASLAEDVTQPLYDALEGATGVKPLNPFGALREASDATVRRLAPDPLTVGTAGQIVNGVASIAAQVAAGAALTAATGGTNLIWGGSTIAGGATGRTTYHEMIEKGVDPSTAVNAAFVDGVATGGGALLPAGIGFSGLAEPLAGYGVRLSTAGYLGANAAVGAGGNVAIGIAQRGAMAEALRAGGYETMARQYTPMDGAAIAADALLGGIFSAAGAAVNLPATGSGTVDAALAARDAKHAAVTTAPGIPADPAAAAAHGSALDKALRDVWDGNPVDVSASGVQNQAFVFGRRDNSVVQEASLQYGVPAAAIIPSTRLADLPLAGRAELPYNAPELNEYAAHIEQQYGLPAGIINALKNSGERSNSNQVSPRGARGVMQFMPENLKKYGVTDPNDPIQMIDAAGRYLRDTARQYGGNVDAMIADYNGGPRQAREVLAGREPVAKETRDYLARVREAMGRGQAWADQAPGGEGLIRIFPEDRARAARAIEQEIASAEAVHADLSARAGQLSDVGRVTAMQEELAGLQQQYDSLAADGVLRDRAKEIQTAGERVSYKRALSEARQQIGAQLEDINGRIDRVQTEIGRNADAARALQQLSDLDARVAALRENRAAIDAPASQLTPAAAAVRQVGGDTSAMRGQAARDADRLAQAASAPAPVSQEAPRAAGEAATPEMAGAPAAAMPRAQAAAPHQAGPDGGPPARHSTDQRAASKGTQVGLDDVETRAGLALLDEQGDIKIQTVDENGNPTEISLRDALADANAELEYATPAAFDAAIQCQLRGGA
ncbi:lytic transglycosylase domain-containing protein [Achromobacter sp. 2789STDY5608628]|uniref:lytic transglycosylase domain-containing protein n=1 Tax=Achromobacter sp. 2789STDY5608628 TaxID=1806493 RepID=UPI0006C19345|nr:lytic transglycosylase domain-containing protein [Achromobacter sp. 2789STDY5608628]CUJ67355.1 Transglycosylase SLT domain [Achromobacter sp. 2789STDY5608628]